MNQLFDPGQDENDKDLVTETTKHAGMLKP